MVIQRVRNVVIIIIEPSNHRILSTSIARRNEQTNQPTNQPIIDALVIRIKIKKQQRRKFKEEKEERKKENKIPFHLENFTFHNIYIHTYT